jgi:hypothetical protein
MSSEKKIRPKERDAILQSIGAGVVPRTGIHHIQVGRVQEVQSLLRDIDHTGVLLCSIPLTSDNLSRSYHLKECNS